MRRAILLRPSPLKLAGRNDYDNSNNDNRCGRRRRNGLERVQTSGRLRALVSGPLRQLRNTAHLLARSFFWPRERLNEPTSHVLIAYLCRREAGR